MIEKNVPLPSKNKKYPFINMEVGDSVLITDWSLFHGAANAAHMVGARNGRKFTSRKTQEGLRIWRIK